MLTETGRGAQKPSLEEVTVEQHLGRRTVQKSGKTVFLPEGKTSAKAL